MSILNLIRPELLNSPDYIPGGDDAKCRLHANELPWAPIESQSIDLNIYPALSLQNNLQDQLADRYGVQNDQLVLTRGSDEGIDLITRLFLTAGKDAFMQFPPTFPMYAFFVRLQQGDLINCPLDPFNDFNLSFERISNSWQPNCKIIMFCNPNNPTGHLLDLKLIAKVCEYYKNKSLIVVDEAYIEFSSIQSATTLVAEFENLVVLRTLSKACGLAGLRLGSIIAQAHVIQAFKKIIPPYTISSVMIELASKALTKGDWFLAARESIQRSKAWLIKELEKLSVIEKIYPTATNFILIKTSCAREITNWLACHGIAVRDFPARSVLDAHLRITVGDEQHNQLLIDRLISFTNNVSGFKNAELLIN